MSRIAIIGAGPIGLEAALLARQLGHEVQVFEKGRVAENILDWGHIRLFSPFGMNSSEWGRGAIARSLGPDALPREDELLTGFEFYERYLEPISQLPEIVGCIHENREVCSIGRKRFGKLDAIGKVIRGQDPFRLLVKGPSGGFIPGRSVFEADLILDCSGTYPNHNWLGAGGARCAAEKEIIPNESYRVALIQPHRFASTTTLIVGGGYSAATAVIELAELAATHPETRGIWLTRPHSDGAGRRAAPIVRHKNDPLPERDRIAERANELAAAGSPAIVWLCDSWIVEIDQDLDTTKFYVTIERENATDSGKAKAMQKDKLVVDRIIANVGYRPDRSIYEELHVHECYATQGPNKLAAKLLGETSSDCLAQTTHGTDVLKNPEPNFFILGSKSYGRNSNFLMRVGIEQVREVLISLECDSNS